MTVYRLATEMYKEDLSGTGAKLYGGRWNSIGIPVLYTTENISLSVLEILVRTGFNTIPDNYHILKLSVPDNMKENRISKEKIKSNWKSDTGLTQWLGSEFIKSSKSLYLKVPSAIVDEEYNFIINPAHRDFAKIKIESCKKFQFDKRLFLQDE
jgi:RES domain-containing protein